jgi:hypothetical protein
MQLMLGVLWSSPGPHPGQQGQRPSLVLCMSNPWPQLGTPLRPSRELWGTAQPSSQVQAPSPHLMFWGAVPSGEELTMPATCSWQMVPIKVK